jgi:hypothetical protein
MHDERSPEPSAEQPNSTDVTASALAAITVAIREFGVNALSRGADADADREAEIGRHILQAVDSALGSPDSLLDTVHQLTADPRDGRALAALHRVVENAVTSDLSLLAQVAQSASAGDPVMESSGVRPRSVPIE